MAEVPVLLAKRFRSYRWRWVLPGALAFIVGSVLFWPGIGNTLFEPWRSAKDSLLNGVLPLFGSLSLLCFAGWSFFRCFGSSNPRYGTRLTYMVASIMVSILAGFLLFMLLGTLADIGILHE